MSFGSVTALTMSASISPTQIGTCCSAPPLRETALLNVVSGLLQASSGKGLCSTARTSAAVPGQVATAGKGL